MQSGTRYTGISKLTHTCLSQLVLDECVTTGEFLDQLQT